MRRGKNHIRSILGSQGNGSVYALGRTGIAVKEANSSHSIHMSTERMDRLYQLFEEGKKKNLIPGWISIPKHYGYLTPPMSARNNRQYLIMEQVDAGVTVEDIISISDRGATEREKVEKRFGYPVSDQDVEDIKNQWVEFNNILVSIVEDSNKNLDKENQKTFKQWMPDIHEGNVLVDVIKTPVDGKKFKFWIIDQ
jgi:hypothetical protein